MSIEQSLYVAFHLPLHVTHMAARTKISSQGRTVIPAKIRERLHIREGEEVEWSVEDGVILAKVMREEHSPDEIMNRLKATLLQVKVRPTGRTTRDMKRKMMDERTRSKLGLMP